MLSKEVSVNQLGVSSEDIGGTQHALLIGNNAYQYWQPLKTAVRDVEGLRDVLVRRYGFKQKDILLYKDVPAEGRCLRDSQSFERDLKRMTASLSTMRGTGCLMKNKTDTGPCRR